MNLLTLRINEFCRLSGLGRSTAWKLIQNGTLETVKVNRCTLIKMDSVEALLGTSKVEAE